MKLEEIVFIAYQYGVKNIVIGSSCHGAVEKNLTRNHEFSGSISGLAQWVKDLVLSWPVL